MQTSETYITFPLHVSFDSQSSCGGCHTNVITHTWLCFTFFFGGGGRGVLLLLTIWKFYIIIIFFLFGYEFYFPR